MRSYRFGIATADITPPLGVQLCGYNLREATWVEHPLRAEALVCDDGTDAWALVTTDLLGVSHTLVRSLRRDIADRTGLAPEAVMFTATHTHSGPRVVAAGWNEFPEEEAYITTLRETLVDLVVRAWEERRPGELVHGRTRAPDLGSNRRVLGEDGLCRNEWADPAGTHTGYFDDTVDIAGIRREDGTLDALLVAYGCHPVCFGRGNTGISADYPGYMKDALEASGKVKTALFAVAGHANIDPRICVQEDPEPVREMGQALARIVLDALPSLAPIQPGPLTAVRSPWEMSLSPERQLMEQSKSYFQVQEPGQTIFTEVQALRAGGLAFVGLPGEVVSEYAGRVRAASPAPATIMFSMANDFIGYLVTDEMLPQGGHEVRMCPIRPAEAAFMETVDTTLRQLQEATETREVAG